MLPRNTCVFHSHVSLAACSRTIYTALAADCVCILVWILLSQGQWHTHTHTHLTWNVHRVGFDSTMNRQVQSKSQPLLCSSDQYMDPHSRRHGSPGSAGTAPNPPQQNCPSLLPLLFSLLPLLCLRSRQLLSHRASHFSQILFSPLLSVPSLLSSLAGLTLQQQSSTLIQNSTTGLNTSAYPGVCACTCVRVMQKLWKKIVLWEWKAGEEEMRRGGKFVYVTSFFLAAWQSAWSAWIGWSLQSTQPSIDPQQLICKIQWLTGCSVCNTQPITCKRDRCE